MMDATWAVRVRFIRLLSRVRCPATHPSHEQPGLAKCTPFVKFEYKI